MSENTAIFSQNESADLQDYHVVKRVGEVVDFDPSRIYRAVQKAFLAAHGPQSATSSKDRDQITRITLNVVSSLKKDMPHGGFLTVESIQDHVERAIMQEQLHEVLRVYVMYREKRADERAQEQANRKNIEKTINVSYEDGIKKLNIKALRMRLENAAGNLDAVDIEPILEETLRNIYDGISISELEKALILACRTRIERDPAYSYLTARILLQTSVREVCGHAMTPSALAKHYPVHFRHMIARAIQAHLANPLLAERFDLKKLGAAIKAERDNQFTYLGLQTLYDRYFLHVQGQRIELPQTFFMRVAMGLALNEDNPTERAIEFYEVLSSFDFMSSTPTLFNSGTIHSQLSSCYLSTVSDDLVGIYDAIKDNALLSKYAGGLGNDWTPVRSLGSRIKGTNGESQGVVPFLKVVNDTAVAVNQGGKRKGAVCAYLETWHLDIEEFLELRKNTGDERRRTHDMNTANWIPDLFMKRVMENADWTLFSPSDCPDLHDKYGKAFEEAYLGYEARAQQGELTLFKKIPAISLWRKMLSMLFETGHPWITFKDPCNIRSPQQHVGVVHSSNLCTEITLNTSETEIAVCNLGSVNLAAHIINGKLDHEKLRKTVRTAIRMLDNVIDINFYAVDKARHSNELHRPIGLGVMGFQDSLYALNIPFASLEAIEFSDESMEAICYYAYEASSDLAVDRGAYSTFKGSLWDQGILPHDTIKRLQVERGGYVDVDNQERLDWKALRAKIQKQGMRNSNCVAIAPTATISNIIGVSPCIEPNYRNLYVKSNLSGEFTVINDHLVSALKKRGLWDDVMIADLKYFDGSVLSIDRIPQDIKALYRTAFEIDPVWVVECAARRSKWIDQAQSLNIFMAGVSGKKLDEIYKLAWVRGLKTTYYLRSTGATNAEKSTGRGGELNAVQNTPSVWLPGSMTQSTQSLPEPEVVGTVCTMRPGDEGFEDCEACQ